MPFDTITPHTIRDALRALRYARSLQPSPLVELDLVTLALRAEGLADTRQSRSWSLGRCLTAAVEEPLARLRAVAGPSDDQELERLVEDLRSGSAERLEWALIHSRYLSPTPPSSAELGRTLGVAERTVRTRLTRGVARLVSELQQRELAATRSLETVTTGTPVERILVDEDAAPRSPLELLGELQSLVSQHRPSLRLSRTQMAEMANYPASELIAYRLGRIAEWSLPRYRIDSRFVEMSLMVDLGEESLSGRWQVREERFSDLRDLLAAVIEPAVVLLGPPGSGKSTLLRRLEMDLSHDALGPGEEVGSAPLTFLISLNQYRPATQDGPWPAPRDWLAGHWATRYPKLPPLAEIAAERPVVFLLDGLNEMPHAAADDYRERVGVWCQFILESLRPAMGDRAVLACRTLDYSAPLSTPAQRVPQVQLEPMSDEKVAAFLERYSPGNAAELWATLEGSTVLDALRWPFMLRLLVEAADGEHAGWQGDAPSLFTSFVRRALVREVEQQNPRLSRIGLLEQRDFERIVGAGAWRGHYALPERGTLIPGLAALAHGMQAAIGAESSQVRIDYDAGLALIGSPESAEVIRAGMDLGVLEEDRAADEVMFQHQLLQEYFAARRLARTPEPERVASPWRAAEITPRLRDLIETLPPAEELPALPQTGWEETTLMAVAMSADPGGYIRGLMATNVVLAGRAAGQPAVRARLPESLLNELRWALVQRSRDPAADLRYRIASGYALGDLGDPRFERRGGPHGAYLLPPLVVVPGGRYPIGDDEPITTPMSSSTDHIPRHEVDVARFAIGRFPVTNAEWACFQDAGGYEDERWWDTESGRAWRRGDGTAASIRAGVRWFVALCRARPEIMDEFLAAGTWDQEMYERGQRRLAMSAEALDVHLTELYPGGRHTEPGFWHDARFNRPAQPVVGICWYEARAYLSWLTEQSGLAFRLPTEVEWEAAARGEAGRAYAYGEGFDCLRGNTVETHVRQTTPVGVFPEGDSALGVSDLAGNIAQWASSAYGESIASTDFPYPYDDSDGREAVDTAATCLRVFRGGSWNRTEFGARASVRHGSVPTGRGTPCGFRLVCASPIAGAEGV